MTDYTQWHTRWDEGRIGFHQPEGNSRLRRHWAPFLQWCGPPHTDRGAKVLVPLCGKTLDLRFLSERHRVLGIEYVERAARAYFRELGVDPQTIARSGGTSYAFERTEILVRDFFGLDASELGRANLAYDRAALVAIPPARRVEYVATLADLVEPGGGLLLISFEHDFGSGPPFSVPEVPELFGERFMIEQREKRDILDEESRFRERGATHMDEIVWYARRRA